MTRKLFFALITLLLVLVVLPGLPSVKSTSEVAIVDPRYSVPYPCLPSCAVNITLVGAGAISSVWIVAPGYNYSLPIVATWHNDTYYIVEVEVPKDVMPELYDIYVETDNGVVREPRALWVLKSYPTNITILHLTDIHIGAMADNNHTATYYYDAAVNLINILPVDFTVITGDDVDNGNDLVSLKKFYLMTNRARKPTFIIPGNHDHYGTNIYTFQQKYYGKYVGPRYWKRILGKFIIIGLDAGARGFLDEEQLHWLENTLKKYENKTKIILIHYPLFNYRIFREVSGSWKDIDALKSMFYRTWVAQISSAQEFLRLIEEYDVKLVLAGHTHEDGLVLYNGKTWFVTTTTTSGQYDSQYHGFRIITVSENGSVKVSAPPDKNPLAERASYNIEQLTLRYIEGPDGLSATIIAEIPEDYPLDIGETTLYFYLKKAEGYKAYGDAKALELKPYGPQQYIATVKAVLEKGSRVVATVAATEDKTPPQVRMDSYTVTGDVVTVYITASDDGWGLDKVCLAYETQSGEKGMVEAYHWKANYYIATAVTGPEATIWVVAIDVAGNTQQTPKVNISQPPEQQTQPQPQTNNTTPQQQTPKVNISQPPEQQTQPQTQIDNTIIMIIIVTTIAVVITAIIIKKRQSK